ncbi:MAG: ABC transporter substrate-binding protein [Bacteroidales bacterium]|nr:ABC transporter substrate-binding protein [Bacteroidales bacterium]
MVVMGACRPRGSAALQDFTRPVYEPVYAVGFEIMGAKGRQSTILKTTRPWQGTSGEETALFIARNGEPTPAGFTGQTVPGGAGRIVCMSSSYVAMLAELNATDRIVAVSGLAYVSNDSVASRRETIAEVGYEGHIDYETLVAMAPDLVLLYGLDGMSPMEAKLRELGIPFVYMGDYLEAHPLGKAEWLVAVAEMLGDRAAGEAVFAELVPRYEALKARVDSAEQAFAKTVSDADGAAAAAVFRPDVMLNAPYGDSWFMPADGSYVVCLIRDAGGHYLYERNRGTRSVPVDMETAMRLTSEADVWCGLGRIATLDELKRLLPNMAGMPCVAAGRVYNDDKRLNAAGGNDYWESGIVHPDWVLRDWIKMLHPELVPEEEFVYFRKLE